MYILNFFYVVLYTMQVIKTNKEEDVEVESRQNTTSIIIFKLFYLKKSVYRLQIYKPPCGLQAAYSTFIFIIILVFNFYLETVCQTYDQSHLFEIFVFCNAKSCINNNFLLLYTFLCFLRLYTTLKHLINIVFVFYILL